MSLRLPPFSVLASFPTPNYTNPVTHGSALTVVNLLFLGLATLALVGRLVARGLVRARLGWDDFLICMAYISTVGIHIVLNLGVNRLGWDRHVWDIRFDVIEGSLKNVYAGELLFFTAAELTALSLLVFYYRISQNTIPWFTWTLHTVVFINIVTFTPFFLMGVFQCRPFSLFWTFPPPENAHCIDPKIIVFGSGIFKTFMDVLVTTVPIPLILTLQLSPAQKRAVVVLLGMGYIVTAAGAVRSYYSYYILWRTYDETWYEYYGFVASTIENDLAVVCACAPALRPLVSRMATSMSTVQSYLSSFRSPRPPVEKRSLSQSGGTFSDATRSELQTTTTATTRTRRPPRGFTFWLTTVDNDSDELTETELREQSSQGRLVSREEDIEWGVHGDGLTPVEPPQVATHEKGLPMLPRDTRDPDFRTWRIDDNPFQGGNNPYSPSQQTYGSRW